MKKVISCIVLALCMIFAALAFSGCGTPSVEGNTYVYESLTVTGGTEQENADVSENLEGIYAGMQISFDTDGSVTVSQGSNVTKGTYTQDGNKINIDLSGLKNEFTVNGNAIEYKMQIESFVATVKFKQTEQSVTPENPDGPDNPDGQITSLANKIFYVSDIKIEDMTGNLSQAEIADLESQFSVMVEGAYLAFYDESVCVVSLGGNIMTGNYAFAANTITITLENDNEDFILEGNKIIKSDEILMGDVTGIYLTMEYTLEENGSMPEIPSTTLSGKVFSFYGTEVEVLSGDLTQAEIDEVISMNNMIGEGSYFTFTNDTSCSYTIQGYTMYGIYSIEGNVLYVTINGSTEEFILTSDTISQTQQDIVGNADIEINIIYSLSNN